MGDVVKLPGGGESPATNLVRWQGQEVGYGWYPIASAPLDGTEIVCLSPQYRGPIMLRYVTTRKVHAWRDWDGDIHYPTHWHPLPPMPRDEG